MALGKSEISGLLESQDIMSTINCMRQLGATIAKREDGVWEIFGCGIGGFSEPQNIIDLGNSGTSARLITGAVCTTPIKCFFTGDNSLRKRPMDRVVKPLSKFGASFFARDQLLLPMCVVGTSNATGIEVDAKVESAQVKSAVLIAGLNAFGETQYKEKVFTRDHTERLLKAFGADIEIEELEGIKISKVRGLVQLIPQKISIPRDPSSAAFPMCAALMVEGSEILIPHICQNPTRIGLQETLVEMGADIKIANQRFIGGEPVADLLISHRQLKGVSVPAHRAASMIDEYPILAILASVAEGRTIMNGIKELRVKESDRIRAVSEGLRASGVKVEETEDSLTVFGNLGKIKGGSTVRTYFDHRIAMSFMCLDLVSDQPVRLDEKKSISTSFEEFFKCFSEIGVNFE